MMLRKTAPNSLTTVHSSHFFKEDATCMPLIRIRENYSESIYSPKCFLYGIVSVNNENLRGLFT